ncbi:RHS repeat-associated core domain-containing protein [Kroppenstedtia eburnea]|uniref:RHS repeat-associated core domain-containing protein n=1 Tax=Kroppenstedtia eburnea TaxID=714067 RepID=UPI0036312D92
MRKTMTTGSQTITFHYDGNNNVIYETDQNNQIVAHYTYGANNELVSMTQGGKTYYYQTNYRGDVTALTDSTGAVVATYEYDAFGNLLKETGTVENPYRYAGYRYDEVTGLYYLQSRYYNPETGRFFTRDADLGEEMEPLTLNKYIYAGNNPVMNTDSDGNFYLKGAIKWVLRGLVNVIFREIIMKPITTVVSFFFPWLRAARGANRAIRSLKSSITGLSRTSFGRRIWRSIKAGIKPGLTGLFLGSAGVRALDAASKYLNPDYYFLRTRIGGIYKSRMYSLKRRILRKIG